MRNRQVYFPRPYEVAFEEKEISDEGLGEKTVLIRNDYTLISPGTELAFYTGTHTGLSDPENTWAKYPFYPGYASVGKVLRVGEKVAEFREGDMVYSLGHHASYELIDTSKIVNRPILKLPTNLPAEEAVFARLAAISMTALGVGRFRVGDYAVVLGLGLIGNFAAQLLGLIGVRVIGIDLVEMRLSKAQECGVQYTINPRNEDVPGRVKEISQGKGVEAVIEATGDPSLIGTALQLVNRRGQVILLGSPRGKAEIDVYRDIHRTGVSLIGAHEGLQGSGGIPDRISSTLYVIDLIAKRILKARELHTHTLEPKEISKAYELLLNRKEEVLGILIDWRIK